MYCTVYSPEKRKFGRTVTYSKRILRKEGRTECQSFVCWFLRHTAGSSTLPSAECGLYRMGIPSLWLWMSLWDQPLTFSPRGDIGYWPQGYCTVREHDVLEARLSPMSITVTPYRSVSGNPGPCVPPTSPRTVEVFSQHFQVTRCLSWVSVTVRTVFADGWMVIFERWSICVTQRLVQVIRGLGQGLKGPRFESLSLWKASEAKHPGLLSWGRRHEMITNNLEKGMPYMSGP